MNRQPETIYEGEASNYQASKFQSPIKSKLTVEPNDDDNSVTLTHTVSFYRKQQTMNSPSVRKQVTYGQTTNAAEPMRRHDKNDEYDDDDDDDDGGLNKSAQNAQKYAQSQEDLVQKKIKSLMDSVMIQNQQIAQASNALNTCASTFEFSGSTESVVAEWKLLVASKFINAFKKCQLLKLIYLFSFAQPIVVRLLYKKCND